MVVEVRCRLGRASSLSLRKVFAMQRSHVRLALVFVVSMGVTHAAFGQTKQEEAAALAAPKADKIATDFLAPAVRQAVANGVASLVARITAEGNDHGLAFPPSQTMKLIEMVEVPAKRVQIEHPVYEHEYTTVEKVVPVMESGQPTGRFTKVNERVVVKSRQVGKRMVEHLTPDPEGSETMKVPKYGPGGPAAWAANLPGLNGMALYVLAKAGLASHPATVKHAKGLATHATTYNGLPDSTFDVAWMAAGFIALGSDSAHDKLARRLVGKLLDGQIRKKGDLDGLWGPVCVNYGYYGKLFTLNQTVKQEIDVLIPKKLEVANAAQQGQLVAMGKEMQALSTAYSKVHRDVFRCGTRMLQIRSPFAFEEEFITPGLPLNAYQWVATDIESTEAATFALALAKQAGMLPRETERLAIRGKKIHPPVKAELVLKAAAKRLSEAVDAEGRTSALARVAKNTGFEKTGFPAPMFDDGEQLPPLFDFETAGTCVAALEALESLASAAPELAKQLDEPRKRARDRATKIAARWYEESANPAAESWKGLYAATKVSHADLTKSATLPPPSSTAEVETVAWGPAGALYRIVPGLRGLFTGVATPKECFSDDLFRQLAYRLVALQDQNGQWSSPDNILYSTASESLTINRVAAHWHATLSRDPPGKIGVPDPVAYQAMLYPEWAGWSNHQASRPDAAVFPTLASLLFLVQAIEGPVSLDGIAILPEPPAEPAKPADPDKPAPRLTPVDAARKVIRPNEPRRELFDAILATQWPRKVVAPPPAAKPAEVKPTEKPAEQPAAEEEDDGLGKFEDLLKSSDGKE